MVELFIRAIFLGLLQRDFIILPDGRVFNDILAGNVLYSAVGWLVWQPRELPGVVARVGEDFPQGWLSDMEEHRIDTKGVRVQSHAMELRNFFAYLNPYQYVQDEPIIHYSRHAQLFPKSLFGYQPSKPINSRTRIEPTSLRSTDIPVEYMNATAAHLAPLDFPSHNLIPSILHQGTITILTLAPSTGYMNPTFFSDVPQIVRGLTAFLPTENQVRNLYKERSEDIWEMAEALSVYGCDIIIIQKEDLGQYVYDGMGHKRWFVPPYPARILSAHAASDVFCGGFLAGYLRNFDPLEAALYGNIAASLAVEGIGPFYALATEPRLPSARLESLRQAVRKC